MEHMTLIKNETKDRDLPCHTMDPRDGVVCVWGGGG
jgi:hypothetical protein